jgi:hypothetical protein
MDSDNQKIATRQLISLYAVLFKYFNAASGRFLDKEVFDQKQNTS